MLIIGMFSAQNMWGYLILLLPKAHTYSCWSTETKLLSFKRADHEILANRDSSQICRKKQKDQCQWHCKHSNFYYLIQIFQSGFKNRQKSDISSGSRRKLQRLVPRITFPSLLLSDFSEVPCPYPSLSLSLHLFHVGFFCLSQTRLKRCAPLAATQDTRVQKSSHVLCCSRRSHNSLEQTLWSAGSFHKQNSFPALLNSTYVSTCEREAEKNGNQVLVDSTQITLCATATVNIANGKTTQVAANLGQKGEVQTRS